MAGWYHHYLEDEVSALSPAGAVELEELNPESSCLRAVWDVDSALGSQISGALPPRSLYAPSLLSSTRALGESPCTLALKEITGIPADSLFFPGDKIPASFYYKMLRKLFFPALVLWFGGPGVGLRPHFPDFSAAALFRFPSVVYLG